MSAKKTYPSLNLSLSTVRRARRDLGWIATILRYCQLIREVNKEKRLKWCNEVNSTDEFLMSFGVMNVQYRLNLTAVDVIGERDKLKN